MPEPQTDPAPYFSVIVPTYNRAHLITATLRSVLAQTLPDLELIVIDDGSTDDTERVVAAIADGRLHYHRVDNGERGRARNLGTQRARGRYVTWLDSDDLWYDFHLAEARACIDAAREPEWCVLPYEVRRLDGTAWPRVITRWQPRLLESGNVLSCSGVFLRKDIALAYQFDETRELAGTEDWLLWLRMAARFAPALGTRVSSTLIDHAERSVRGDLSDRLDTRKRLLLAGLRADPAAAAHYGLAGLRRIEAHMLGYSALHLAMAGHRNQVVPLLWQTALLSPAEIFTRRTLAILKRTLLPHA